MNIVMLFWTVIVFFSTIDWTVDQLWTVNICNQATRKLDDLAKKTKRNKSDITLKAVIAIFTGKPLHFSSSFLSQQCTDF